MIVGLIVPKILCLGVIRCHSWIRKVHVTKKTPSTVRKLEWDCASNACEIHTSVSLTLIDLQSFRSTHPTTKATLSKMMSKALRPRSLQSDVIHGFSSSMKSLDTDRNCNHGLTHVVIC
eukprot:452866-Amphidinium_carterae.1